MTGQFVHVFEVYVIQLIIINTTKVPPTPYVCAGYSGAQIRHGYVNPYLF